MTNQVLSKLYFISLLVIFEFDEEVNCANLFKSVTKF